MLHLTLQKMRWHCESKGKAEIWTIFEELLLAPEIQGRRAPSREELLRQFPGKDGQFLDNRLTTAKRIFRRLLPEVIPPRLTEQVGHGAVRGVAGDPPGLAVGPASRLHLAFRVTPAPSGDPGSCDSLELAARTDTLRGLQPVEELPRDLSNDELSILLSFRLEMPLADFLGRPELAAVRNFADPATGRERPLCLLSLVESPPEALADAGFDLVGLLNHVKQVAKWTHSNPDHAMPAEISKVLYNLAPCARPARMRRADRLARQPPVAQEHEVGLEPNLARRPAPARLPARAARGWPAPPGREPRAEAVPRRGPGHMTVK